MDSNLHHEYLSLNLRINKYMEQEMNTRIKS